MASDEQMPPGTVRLNEGTPTRRFESSIVDDQRLNPSISTASTGSLVLQPKPTEDPDDPLVSSVNARPPLGRRRRPSPQLQSLTCTA